MRRSRASKITMALLLGGGLWFAYGACRPPPQEESLTPAETRKIYAALLSRVKAGGQNHLHSRRLYYYAPAFAKPAKANVHVVQAAALLHDATKENGDGEPKERFCTHGEQGAEQTQKTLEGIGKSKAFSTLASTAVREHMGPCGFNWSFFSKRFMTKFCARTYPKPVSVEAQVLYDIDMLDLMTVDGVVKVVEMRQQNPEFEKEPLKDSVVSGSDSAWKSVVDAKQTLTTETARECGRLLTLHTEGFVNSLDWDVVKDLPAFKSAAAAYLAKSPLPSCLPQVPPFTGDAAMP